MNGESPITFNYVYVSGAFIHACQHSGQHLVTFEKETVNFNAILARLHDPTPSPLIGGLQSLNMVGEDEDEHVRKVPKKSRLSA